MWETAKKFFEAQSALANFVQIAGALAAVALASWRGYGWVDARLAANRITSISKWLEGQHQASQTARSLTVAVVDDHPEDYPLDVMRRLGYSITHIGNLTLADVPSLLKFDCILLDINGVLKEDLRRGGLEVLKRLKATGGPYVVAVSSKGFDITMSEFFMLADHRLKKPIPHTDIEGIIERAFTSTFSAEHAAHRIDEAAAFATSRSRATKKAIAAARTYLESGRGKDEARTSLALIVPGDQLESTLIDLEVVRRSTNRAS